VPPQNWIKQGDVPRVMIPVEIFPRLVLGVPAARVYAALAMRAHNVSGLVDSTREQIADDSGLSLTQVKSGVRLLVEAGWITRHRLGTGRTSSKYQMHAAPSLAPADSVAEGGGNPTPSGAENRPPEGRESDQSDSTEDLRGGRESDRVGNPPPRGSEIRPEGGGNPPPLLSIQRTCLTTLETTTSAALPSDDGSAGDEPASKPKSAPEPKAVEPARADVEQLCQRLHERVIANDFRATVTAKWRTEARLLLDRDQRSLDQALRLIDWATAPGCWWAPNIRSMPTFREKYDQLLGQARREQQQRVQPKPNRTDANIAALLGQTGTGGPNLIAIRGGNS
jgi:hypothetical protein